MVQRVLGHSLTPIYAQNSGSRSGSGPRRIDVQQLHREVSVESIGGHVQRSNQWSGDYEVFLQRFGGETQHITARS